MNPSRTATTIRRLSASLAGIGALVVARAAAAQLTIDTSVGDTLGLGTADLKQSVTNFLQFILGLLGLIAVTLIIYGGILWMTAAGNENQVDKAKRVITSAAIGLIIVILSWAIVIFVVGTTSNVTQ